MHADAVVKVKFVNGSPVVPGADSAGRRDARRRAVSIVRSGSAALAGAGYWMMEVEDPVTLAEAAQHSPL